MWQIIRGVKVPKNVKPNTPFFISFHSFWLTLTPWKRVTIGFKLFEDGELLLYTSCSFIPGWFWGKTLPVTSSALYITKKTKFLIDIGRVI